MRRCFRLRPLFLWQARRGKADDDGIVPRQHEVDPDDLHQGNETCVSEDLHSVPSIRCGVRGRALKELFVPVSGQIGADEGHHKSARGKFFALPRRAATG